MILVGCMQIYRATDCEPI